MHLLDIALISSNSILALGLVYTLRRNADAIKVLRGQSRKEILRIEAAVADKICSEDDGVVTEECKALESAWSPSNSHPKIWGGDRTDFWHWWWHPTSKKWVRASVLQPGDTYVPFGFPEPCKPGVRDKLPICTELPVSDPTKPSIASGEPALERGWGYMMDAMGPDRRSVAQGFSLFMRSHGLLYQWEEDRPTFLVYNATEFQIKPDGVIMRDGSNDVAYDCHGETKELRAKLSGMKQ